MLPAGSVRCASSAEPSHASSWFTVSSDAQMFLLSGVFCGALVRPSGSAPVAETKETWPGLAAACAESSGVTRAYGMHSFDFLPGVAPEGLNGCAGVGTSAPGRVVAPAPLAKSGGRDGTPDGLTARAR